MGYPIELPQTPTLHDGGDGRLVCLPRSVNILRSLEVKADKSGTFLQEACAECGAFFEDGRLIGWNLEAAQALRPIKMDLRLPGPPGPSPEPNKCPECDGWTGNNDCPVCHGDGFTGL